MKNHKLSLYLAAAIVATSTVNLQSATGSSADAAEMEHILAAALAEFATISPATSPLLPEAMAASPKSRSRTGSSPIDLTASPRGGIESPEGKISPLSESEYTILNRAIQRQTSYIQNQAAALQRLGIEIPELSAFVLRPKTGPVLFALIPTAKKAVVRVIAKLPSESTNPAAFIAKLRASYQEFNPDIDSSFVGYDHIRFVPGWRASE